MALSSPDQHIEVTPGTCGGKPRIRSRRITVENIVVWHERLGLSADEISSEYDLTLSEIYAALAYYYDHQADIDKSMRDDDDFVEAIRRATPSKVKEKLQGLE